MIRGQPVYFIAKKSGRWKTPHPKDDERVLEEKAKRGRSEDPHGIVL